MILHPNIEPMLLLVFGCVTLAILDARYRIQFVARVAFYRHVQHASPCSLCDGV